MGMISNGAPAIISRNPLKSGQGFNPEPKEPEEKEEKGRNPLKSGQGFNKEEFPDLRLTKEECRNPLKSGQGFNKTALLRLNISILVAIPLNRVKVSIKSGNRHSNPCFSRNPLKSGQGFNRLRECV